MRYFKIISNPIWSEGWGLFANENYHSGNREHKAVMNRGDFIILLSDKIIQCTQKIYSLIHGKNGYHDIYDQLQNGHFKEL